MTTSTPIRPLTDRQREIYRWIVQYIATHGYSPTVRELCLAFRFDSPNGAMCHLLPLRKKGYLAWNERQSRTIRPLQQVDA
jgi:repressor LexA